jgi:hypothetical protein
MAWNAGHYPKQIGKMVDVLKRKMLQRIYGPVKNTDQQKYRFKIKTSQPLYRAQTLSGN